MGPAAADIAPIPAHDVASPKPVTRVEILDVLDDAFANGPATRQTLVATARAQGARPEVIALLEQLPERTYVHQRQLWVHMADVPVGL